MDRGEGWVGKVVGKKSTGVGLELKVEEFSTGRDTRMNLHSKTPTLHR